MNKQPPQPPFPTSHRPCPPTVTGGVRPVATALLALLLASACAVQPAAQTAPEPQPKVQTDAVAACRAVVTRTLVLSCREDADCATVGVGARSCGGPEQYLAYAVRETSATALQRAVQDHARLRKKQIEERGEMSTCEVLPDPGAYCAPAGQCQVRPSRGASTGSLLR